jgi:hypothetical protein
MARTVQDIKSPETPTPGSPRAPSTSLRPVVGWAGVVVAVVAAAVLAAITLTPSDDHKPIDHPGLAEHGSIRAIEGSVEDSVLSLGRLDSPPAARVHPGPAEHSSIRAIEGSVEDSARSRGGSDHSPVTGAHSGLIEHGSIRAIEGSVEDS